jgi:hypothetical protein
MTKSAKVILISLLLGSTTPSFADWPIALPDQKTIHPEQFIGSYNEFTGTFSRIYSSINVLDNDFGADLRIVETNAWSKNGGQTLITSSGRGLAYLPKIGFVGDDTFWYVMEDSEGRRNAAKVTVTVKSADSRFPDPSDDIVALQKNNTIRINVLKNDVFKNIVFDDIGTLSQFNEWSESGGQVKLEKPSTYAYPQLIYTPPSDFTGTDTFWYAIKSKNSDDVIVEHAAKVTIEVSNSNQAGAYPVTQEDFATVEEVICERACPGTVGQFSVLTNDIGNNLKITTDAYSLNGGFAHAFRRNWLTSPSISYTASAKAIEAGEDKVWYVIEDEVGRKNWGVVNITLIAAQ